MTLVIDASVACKWFFNEPLSAEARRLAASDATFVAPDMILAECANAAWRRVRDGTVTPAHARAFLDSLPLWFEALPPAAELHKAAFEMAHELGHPVYDCLYLALAEREQALVVTADRVFAARVGGSRWRNLVENLSRPGHDAGRHHVSRRDVIGGVVNCCSRYRAPGRGVVEKGGSGSAQHRRADFGVKWTSAPSAASSSPLPTWTCSALHFRLGS